MNRRIIYFLEPFNFPSGGVAVIYEHVEILSQNGFNAFVALPGHPAQDFYGSRAPILLHEGKLDLSDDDIYVMPEGFLAYLNLIGESRGRKIMFCQNQYNMQFTFNLAPGFAEYGVDKVFVSSQAIQDFMRDVYGLRDVPLIPPAIKEVFHTGMEPKIRQIAFMPRKLPQEAAYIQATFWRMYPQWAHVPWVAIDQISQSACADILRQSAVFLSLSHQESLGLPPLEAMACGCLVAGFHGDGGREYANPHNGWWAETGDWRACVHGLAQALTLFEHPQSYPYARLRHTMAATVAWYSRARMKQELLQFWERELSLP